MLLLIDDKNSTSNMLQVNVIHTLLGILGMSFKHIEVIKCRVNNKRIILSMSATNRLKILKSFNTHSEHMKKPLEINDWMNVYDE